MTEQSSRFQQSAFYHQSAVKLAASLVLKSEVTADVMNQQVDRYYASFGIDTRVDLNSPETWRYFCHLAGEYHDYDILTLREPIEIRSLDTLQMIPLTKETLAGHANTLAHYQAKGEFYQDLVKRYPDYHLLIDGICRPLDKKKCIEAVEFTILDYDRTLVEKQEFYLIDELNKQIQAVVKRYHSRNYRVTNDAYNTIKLAILGIHLPGMIIALREQYIGTPYVHSFHLWNYLGSHHNLDQFRDYLTFDQAMWLYMNIRHVEKNAGMQSTFEVLVDLLLSERGINLYGFDIQNQNGEIIITRDKINFKDKYHDIKSIDDILALFEKERDLANRNDAMHNHSLNGFRDLMGKSTNSHRPTKLLEAVSFDYSNVVKYPYAQNAIWYWLYLASHGKYHAVSTLTHPYSGESFTITALDGFILFLYLSIRLANNNDEKLKEMVIPSFTAYDILRDKVDWKKPDAVRNKQYQLSRGMGWLKQHYPKYEDINSVKHFKEFVEKVIKYREGADIIIGSYGDGHLYHEMEHMVRHLLVSPNIELNPNQETFGMFIDRVGIPLGKLRVADCIELANRLYQSFTQGVESKTKKTEEVQKAMLAILKRLSSYSIQFTSRVEGKDVRVISRHETRFAVESAYESTIRKSFNRHTTQVVEIDGMELSRLEISRLDKVDQENSVRGMEINDANAIPYMGYGQIGQSVHAYDVPIWRPVWYIEQMADVVPRSQYFTHQGTIYLKQSNDSVLQGYLTAKRGMEIPMNTVSVFQ